MDSAIYTKLETIIDAKDLKLLSELDKDGFICRGCGVKVIPASYKNTNQRQPHFKSVKFQPHKDFCSITGTKIKTKIKKRNKLQKLENGQPASFPCKLVLIDLSRKAVKSDEVPEEITHRNSRSGASENGEKKVKSSNKWTAMTIRPIARTYLDFYILNKQELALPLQIDHVESNTYRTVFERIYDGEIKEYKGKKIYFAPLSWKKLQPYKEGSPFVIQLNVGKWEKIENHLKQLSSNYQLIIDTK